MRNRNEYDLFTCEDIRKPLPIKSTCKLGDVWGTVVLGVAALLAISYVVGNLING